MSILQSFARPCIFAFALAALNLQAAESLRDGDLVAICGDSITEQRQYSAYMQGYLLMCQPKADLNTVQFGRGGERAIMFVDRIFNDIAPFEATVGTTCYGMNDGEYQPINDKIRDTYRQKMTEAVQKMKQSGMRMIVVGSPGVVDPVGFKGSKCSAAEYNEALKELGRVAKEVAEAEGVIFADVHTPMMEGMTKAKAKLGEDYKIAPDGVHPSPNGHLAMAYAFLKALGCDGNIGSITVNFADGKAEADPAQKILSASGGTVEVESTRYPFCFTGQEGDAGTRTMSEFIPFNQDLNRYMLIVKNAPAKARVTWGEESREYSGQELEKGVNLAADFVKHPFAAPFAKVSNKISEQQNFERIAILSALHSLLNWRKSFPDGEHNYTNMQNMVLKKAKEFRAASRAAVTPVRHTIKIEPVS